MRLVERIARAAVLALAGIACCAMAQDENTVPVPSAPAELGGTLAKVRQSGAIALGYRESSIPFSYKGPRGEPIGYSVELCKALVTSIEAAIHRSLAIRWVPVTSDNRIEAVAGGRVDVECGSTTANLERRRQVAFSPIVFVAGTKVMVKKGSPIRDFRALAGKAVAVTAGTTNGQVLRRLSEKFGLGIRLTVTRDHAEGFAKVASGEADAFATDDVLLYGLIAENNAKGSFQVVGDYLSYDPYGLMFRKDDPQFAQVVKDSFQALAADGEIERQYKRWFLNRLPSGASLDLPMSAQLEAILETMALKSE
ncbi:MAG: amino acid ABC transporter substrate-binding protein [Xenophilus sp.]